MASIDGPKSIVLVSEGIVIDRNTIDELRRFSLAAERARVTFFALNLPMALADVGGRYNMTTARMLDQKVLFDGMSMLAVAGRGEAFMISGTPLGALARIDGETSGYYLVSFDATRRIATATGRELSPGELAGATVRARTDFTVNPEPPPVRVPADLKARSGRCCDGRWRRRTLASMLIPIRLQTCADAMRSARSWPPASRRPAGRWPPSATR